MDIKEYEELFGSYESEHKECDCKVSYATKEECEALCKIERERKRVQRELEEAIEKDKQERWKARKNVYTVREVYLIERNGEPVNWYYDRYFAECEAEDIEYNDFCRENEE